MREAALATPERTRLHIDGGWLLAIGVLLLAALVSAAVLAVPSNPLADVVHYKYWTRQIATYGVSGAYSGTYPDSAAIYPPVTMYGYRVAGWLYRHFYDPTFFLDRALNSDLLAVLVKLVAVVPQLISIPVIYGLLRRRFGSGPALAAAAAVGLNPAAIFDSAFWGQPDMVHALFLLIAIYCFEEDRSALGFVFVGLAAATKPQAWALMPFIAYVSLRRFGIRGTVVGGVVAALTVLVVCIPYLVYGTFGELLKLPALIAETMPVASANAHNIWWLITDAKPDFVPDGAPLLGPLSIRSVALVLSVIVIGYGLWRTNPWARDGQLSAMGAYLAFGWFLVTTRAHENHAFFALPLLVMATPRSPFHWLMFAAISTTLFLNMTLHDYGLQDWWIDVLGSENWTRIQLLNATANVALFLIWSVRVWPRQSNDRVHPAGSEGTLDPVLPIAARDQSR
jgi:dolichyl-phosphate-mannose-protein mannosyltransferase